MEHMGTLFMAQFFYKPKTALKCFLLIKNDTGNTHVVNSLYVPREKQTNSLPPSTKVAAVQMGFESY